MAAAVQSRFREAFEEHNFKKRCNLLSALGRDLKSSANDLEKALDELAPLGDCPPFFDHGRLLVAKAAGCIGYGKKFLDHSSQTVRFEAVRGKGLLTAEDAHSAFLSENSSRKLKKFLVKCPALVSSDQILEHGMSLFGEKDKEVFWDLILKVQDEAVLKSWLLEKCPKAIEDYMSDAKRLKGLPHLAQKFPHTALSLVRKGTIETWQWYWLKDILTAHPETALTEVLVEGLSRGSGPKRGYDPCGENQDLLSTVQKWGWRQHPDIMVKILKECSGNASRTWIEGVASMESIIKNLMDTKCTRHYLTTNQKIRYLLQVWDVLPTDLKESFAASAASATPSQAAGRVRPATRERGGVRLVSENAPWFVAEHLPDASSSRPQEMEVIMQAMWKIVNGLSREARRTLLIGDKRDDEGNPTGTSGFVECFARKLPCPQAINDFFFKIIEENEVGNPLYLFMQTLAHSDDGHHDNLMYKVFERFLRKEGETAPQIVLMFDSFYKGAKTQDVIQKAFNLLLKKLDDQVSLSLLRQVVRRMGALELESRANDSKIPVAEEPIPTSWVSFAHLPKKAAPHIAFLLTALHSGTGDADLLGAMLEKHGRSFFWDSFDTVLTALEQGTTQTSLLQPLSWPQNLQETFKNVSVVKFASVDPAALSKSTSKDLGSAGEAWAEYFAGIGDAKKKVNVKDPQCRNEGYGASIKLAASCKDKSKPFEDLLPFLSWRFNAEQEPCRTFILEHLFRNALPIELFEPNLATIRSLWKMSSKARERDSHQPIWDHVAQRILSWSMKKWEAGDPPSELCLFALEVNVNNVVRVDDVLLSVAKESNGKAFAAHPEKLKTIAKWVVETTVPLESEAGLPVSDFWSLLRKLGSLRSAQHEERTLWEEWPFLQKHWAALLAQGYKQKTAEYIFITVLKNLVLRQDTYRGTKVADRKAPWWEPVDCPEYKSAVAAIMMQIESGEIPAKEGSAMLRERISLLAQVASFTDMKLLKKKQQEQGFLFISNRRGLRAEQRKQILKRCPTGQMAGDISNRERGAPSAMQWVEKEKWDLQARHSYEPLPWTMFHIADKYMLEEIATLSKVLASGQSRRDVLWWIVDIAAMVAGPAISDLVESAIATLDPLFEGRARCIGRHYPYLNCTLSRGGSSKTTSDLLTPLLELWLVDDVHRDRRVEKLMQRPRCEHYLFFGHSFSRHLSNARQEWLHQCLSKLSAQTEHFVEFYHFPRRGPTVRDLACLGPGNECWRQALKNSRFLAKPQLYLWHPDTLTQFLEKGTQSTEVASLSLIPRATFADCFSKVSQILESYPREQSKKDASIDLWGFEVLQAAGAYSDLDAEVERRFKELPDPVICDAVDDQQVEALLAGLGKSDDATESLKVLGNYAGKVKQAKEAVTKMMSQVSPPQARVLIKDVMLPRKAGIGLQTAGVKKIAQLHIPDALGLYAKAWNGGRCATDVAACVLVQVALASDLPQKEVRSFFDYFNTDSAQSEDRKARVADILLDQLICSTEWSLPFLPEVIAKLAILPNITTKAVSALKANNSHPTEVLKALTEIMQAASLATRTSPAQKEGPNHQLLGDLKGLQTLESVRSMLSSVSRMDLLQADAETLLKFVLQLFALFEDIELNKSHDDRGSAEARSLLQSLLGCWACLLRSGGRTQWETIIADMHKRLTPIDHPYTAVLLAHSLCDHARGRVTWADSEEYSAMVTVLGTFFSSLFTSGELTVECTSKEQSSGADDSWLSWQQEKEGLSWTLVVEKWAPLLAAGCREVDTDLIFKHCPLGKEIALATQLVTIVLKAVRDRGSEKVAGPRTQRRPCGGWMRSGGIPVLEVKVGSEVEGIVTNSSKQFGVFLNFGCVRDGKLNVPEGDYKNYRVGDLVPNCVVNKVEVSSKSGTSFIELLLVGSASKVQDVGGNARAVARRAVKWLASTNRDGRLNTLSKLLGEVMGLEVDGSFFEEDLASLGTPPPSTKQLLPLVREVLYFTNSKEVARTTLRWLAQKDPREAVLRWPSLLALGGGVAGGEGEEESLVSDVADLLKLCKDHNLRLPVLSDAVAKDLPTSCLELLAHSDSDEARLLCIQVMQQKPYTRGQPPALLADLKDRKSSQVVRASANLLWKSLGGPEDEVEDDEDENE